MPVSRLAYLLGTHLDEDLEEGLAFDRWRRRARADLRVVGLEVTDETRPDGTLVWRLVPAEVSRWLGLDPEQNQMRRQIAFLLNQLSPDRRLIETPALYKSHIPTDVIEFEYGADFRPVRGIAYRQTREGLAVRTDEGCFSFSEELISGLRLVERREERVTGPARPPLAPGRPLPPGRRARFSSGRGRPENLSVLRDVYRAVQLTRTRGVRDEFEIASLDLEELSTDLERPTEDLTARLLAVLGGVMPHAWVGDDGKLYVPSEGFDAIELDGADALLARLELAAVEALNGIEVDLGVQWDAALLADYRRTLDGFLDSAEIDEERLPAARTIIAAMDVGDEVAVQSADTGHWHTLRPERLLLHSWRWFVSGALDGTSLPASGIPISRWSAAAETR